MPVPPISIGNQDFGSIRKGGAFYVDKTSFIREWWDSQDVVTLVTRPRRFGKTLNLSMLDWFFSVNHAGSGSLFEGLDIWSDQRFRDLQGTWPVIFVSFADIKDRTYEQARQSLCQKLTTLYGDHRYVRDWPEMDNADRAYFDSVGPEMNDATASDALQQLARFMERHYGKKAIILLDEYDAPLQEAYVEGYWDQMVGLTRNLFNATFKTNPYLERGIMTGVTRVSKESVFSDLNNLRVVSTTTPQYQTSFGFTEDEVRAALDQRGMADRMDQVREWYDGFRFGGVDDIYNPWSITQFLDLRQLAPYWANTSSNSLVSKVIREGSVSVKLAMEDLLDGHSIEKRIEEEVVFSQLDGSEDAVWGLLVAAGYLRVNEVRGSSALDRTYVLSLTNLEVKMMFARMVAEWFGNPRAHYNDFVKALLLNDAKYMNRFMNTVALETCSSFDAGNQPSEQAEPERFYHDFVLGLIVDLRGRYQVRSNRESGFGRYDVMLEPIGPSDPAYVLEFKVHDPDDEKTLADTVTAALAQIEAKGYDAELVARGIEPARIHHYGFAFEGKRVLIG